MRRIGLENAKKKALQFKEDMNLQTVVLGLSSTPAPESASNPARMLQTVATPSTGPTKARTPRAAPPSVYAMLMQPKPRFGQSKPAPATTQIAAKPPTAAVAVAIVGSSTPVTTPMPSDVNPPIDAPAKGTTDMTEAELSNLASFHTSHPIPTPVLSSTASVVEKEKKKKSKRKRLRITYDVEAGRASKRDLAEPTGSVGLGDIDESSQFPQEQAAAESEDIHDEEFKKPMSDEDNYESDSDEEAQRQIESLADQIDIADIVPADAKTNGTTVILPPPVASAADTSSAPRTAEWLSDKKKTAAAIRDKIVMGEQLVAILDEKLNAGPGSLPMVGSEAEDLKRTKDSIKALEHTAAALDHLMRACLFNEERRVGLVVGLNACTSTDPFLRKRNQNARRAMRRCLTAGIGNTAEETYIPCTRPNKRNPEVDKVSYLPSFRYTFRLDDDKTETAPVDVFVVYNPPCSHLVASPQFQWAGAYDTFTGAFTDHDFEASKLIPNGAPPCTWPAFLYLASFEIYTRDQGSDPTISL